MLVGYPAIAWTPLGPSQLLDEKLFFLIFGKISPTKFKMSRIKDDNKNCSRTVTLAAFPLIKIFQKVSSN